MELDKDYKDINNNKLKIGDIIKCLIPMGILIKNNLYEVKYLDCGAVYVDYTDDIYIAVKDLLKSMII